MPKHKQGLEPMNHPGDRRRHHSPEDERPERGRHHEFGGRRGGPGHHGGGGPHGHGRQDLHSGRKLSSADLQLLLVALLADCPAHGYELIKSLDDRSHGLYVPSPGMVYPALTYLEEIGYATVEIEGARKRYSVTETGRGYYEQNREVATRILADLDRIGAQMAQARQAVESGLVGDDERGPISNELDAARHDIRAAQRKDGPYTDDESRRMAEILTRTAAEIRALLAEPKVK